MWRLNRTAYATVAWMTLAGVACIAPIDAQGGDSREGYEHQPSEAARQAARREAEARLSRRTHPARAQQPPPAYRSAASGTHLPSGSRVHDVSRGLSAGQLGVVRYGNNLSGTVERTIRPGLVNRTFVSGGHVLYSHLYQRHVWHQFGRAFAYEAFVPAMRYPGAYYAWALAAWPHPVTYTWGWQVQPWYPMYGSLFTPYPVYTSPDLWMTDYIIAQSMQTAYQAQTVATATAPALQRAPAAPAPDSSIGVSAAPPGGAASASRPSDALPPPRSSGTPSAPVALPPAMTPQVKAQLTTQIKVQLQEQQAATATPVTLTTQSTPPALRPSHVFFQVVQPLDVATDATNSHCSLSANDYIRRTGGMSQDDWMIPVVVELSRSSDCPEGLRTRIGLNDLNAMENEQEAQVMEAMQAASKSMGPNGPPSSSGSHPTLIVDGRAAPEPSALETIPQAR